MKNTISDWLLNELPYHHYWLNIDKDMHIMEKGSGRSIVMVHGNLMCGYLYKKVLDGIDDCQSFWPEMCPSPLAAMAQMEILGEDTLLAKIEKDYKINN